MLENLAKMTNPQQTMFKDICNKLLAYNFLARDKKDNKRHDIERAEGSKAFRHGEHNGCRGHERRKLRHSLYFRSWDQA